MRKRRLALVVLALVVAAPVFSVAAFAQAPQETPSPTEADNGPEEDGAENPDDGQGNGSDGTEDTESDDTRSQGDAGAPSTEDIMLTPVRTEIVFGFQGERDERTQSFTFDLVPAAAKKPSAIVLGDFISSTGPHVIPADDADVDVDVDRPTQTATLEVKVTPTIDQWEAGEFISSIRVGGGDFESTTIPVRLTFRSGSHLAGGLVALGVLGGGLLVGLLFRANAASVAEEVKKINVSKKKPAFAARWLTAIITAAAGVAYGFDSQYLGNGTFGAGGFTDWLELFAWGFAAGFSGKTVFDYTATKAAST